MTRWMKLVLVTVALGIGAFAFSAGMNVSEALADAECNCTIYVCPGYPHLKCLGKVNQFSICDNFNTNCQCDQCP